MKFFGFMAFIAGIILIGCADNEGDLELKGKVLDEKTKIAIPNRKIIVQALEPGDKKLNPFYVGEFCTDSSGYFAYSLRKIKNIYLYEFCIVGDSSYAFSNYKLGLTELKRYGKFLSFYLSKLADFTIAIERKSKTPFQETLYVSWRSNGMDGKKLYPYTIKNYGIRDHGNTLDMPCKWIGGDIKSAIKTKVYADKETIVRWELHGNRKIKEFTDTIFCKRDVYNYVYFKN
jgi:hypothetical protein